jgi:phage terminase large subunit-like protein
VVGRAGSNLTAYFVRSLLSEGRIREAGRDRQVVSIVADPFRWTRSLQVLLGEGFPVFEYPQTPGRLSPATNSFYEAVVNRVVTHDGDPELALHMAHASSRPTREGGSGSSRTSRSRPAEST